MGRCLTFFLSVLYKIRLVAKIGINYRLKIIRWRFYEFDNTVNANGSFGLSIRQLEGMLALPSEAWQLAVRLAVA